MVGGVVNVVMVEGCGWTASTLVKSFCYHQVQEFVHVPSLVEEGKLKSASENKDGVKEVGQFTSDIIQSLQLECQEDDDTFSPTVVVYDPFFSMKESRSKFVRVVRHQVAKSLPTCIIHIFLHSVLPKGGLQQLLWESAWDHAVRTNFALFQEAKNRNRNAAKKTSFPRNYYLELYPNLHRTAVNMEEESSYLDGHITTSLSLAQSSCLWKYGSFPGLFLEWDGILNFDGKKATFKQNVAIVIRQWILKETCGRVCVIGRNDGIWRNTEDIHNKKDEEERNSECQVYDANEVPSWETQCSAILKAITSLAASIDNTCLFFAFLEPKSIFSLSPPSAEEDDASKFSACAVFLSSLCSIDLHHPRTAYLAAKIASNEVYSIPCSVASAHDVLSMPASITKLKRTTSSHNHLASSSSSSSSPASSLIASSSSFDWKTKKVLSLFNHFLWSSTILSENGKDDGPDSNLELAISKAKTQATMVNMQRHMLPLFDGGARDIIKENILNTHEDEDEKQHKSRKAREFGDVHFVFGYKARSDNIVELMDARWRDEKQFRSHTDLQALSKKFQRDRDTLLALGVDLTKPKPKHLSAKTLADQPASHQVRKRGRPRKTKESLTTTTSVMVPKPIRLDSSTSTNALLGSLPSNCNLGTNKDSLMVPPTSTSTHATTLSSTSFSTSTATAFSNQASPIEKSNTTAFASPMRRGGSLLNTSTLSSTNMTNQKWELSRCRDAFSKANDIIKSKRLHNIKFAMALSSSRSTQDKVLAAIDKGALIPTRATPRSLTSLNVDIDRHHDDEDEEEDEDKAKKIEEELDGLGVLHESLIALNCEAQCPGEGPGRLYSLRCRTNARYVWQYTCNCPFKGEKYVSIAENDIPPCKHVIALVFAAVEKMRGQKFMRKVKSTIEKQIEKQQHHKQHSQEMPNATTATKTTTTTTATTTKIDSITDGGEDEETQPVREMVSFLGGGRKLPVSLLQPAQTSSGKRKKKTVTTSRESCVTEKQPPLRLTASDLRGFAQLLVGMFESMINEQQDRELQQFVEENMCNRDEKYAKKRSKMQEPREEKRFGADDSYEDDDADDNYMCNEDDVVEPESARKLTHNDSKRNARNKVETNDMQHASLMKQKSMTLAQKCRKHKVVYTGVESRDNRNATQRNLGKRQHTTARGEAIEGNHAVNDRDTIEQAGENKKKRAKQSASCITTSKTPSPKQKKPPKPIDTDESSDHDSDMDLLDAMM
eukprot:m.67532 g.67532  ORF g.67532 m.67532 type:complete len:1229 (+) comp8219_c0_seq2:69-3755(+)